MTNNTDILKTQENKKWLVSNCEGTKGIIIKAKDADEARKRATNAFYSPFPRKNDLNSVQRYEPGKHLFIRHNGNKKFGFVQFHTMGGVATNYDANLDTEPTQRQKDFLNNPIEYIKFFETEKHRY